MVLPVSIMKMIFLILIPNTIYLKITLHKPTLNRDGADTMGQSVSTSDSSSDESLSTRLKACFRLVFKCIVSDMKKLKFQFRYLCMLETNHKTV